MISKECCEYATLFCAGKIQSFRHITWPMLIPTFIFTIVFSVMNTFKCYRKVFLLGGKYPAGRIYLLQHFMNNTFESMDYQKLSSAALVMAAVMVLVIGLLFLVDNKLGKDVEEE